MNEKLTKTENILLKINQHLDKLKKYSSNTRKFTYYQTETINMIDKLIDNRIDCLSQSFNEFKKLFYNEFQYVNELEKIKKTLLKE